MTLETLLFDPAPLQPYLQGERRRLLLTPNRRLASRIRRALAAQSGAVVAEAAPVLALGDWLDELWQQLQFRGDASAAVDWVLSAEQELCLWEECVAASAAGAALLRRHAAAQQAAVAYRTLALWRQLTPDAGARAEFDDNPDSAAFAEWRLHFEQLCRQRHCLAAAARDERVVQAAEAGRLALPPRVLCIGFEEVPPLHRALLDRVAECTEWTPPARNRSAVCVGCESLEQQLQAAALWVAQRLREQPAGPFAIVVPDLTQQRALVERVLLDVFAPLHQLPGRGRPPALLNFSAGEPLAQTPLVASALQLLALVQPECDRETVLAILQSPFHSIDAPQCEAAAAATAAVCDLRTRTVGSGQLRAIAANTAERGEGWPFAVRLQQLSERVRRERLTRAQLPLARWAEIFAELLALLGWPGSRGLDSIEYQQQGLWQQALAEFGELDRVTAAADFGAALQHLQRSLQARPFQPKTADAPVQVLGVLEAAGLQFHGLWLCDMDDERWPAQAAPHPLLPRGLQRRLRMPRCDARREYDIALRLGNSLLANADVVVVSFQREREEVQRGPSALFRELPLLAPAQLLGGEPAQLLPAAIWQREQRRLAVLQPFVPGRAPPLSAGERARGGAGLFRDQAACPFQAFARHRLGAQPLAAVQDGLDAAERGSLLHYALDHLWRGLRDSAQLRALSAEERAALAREAAAEAVAALRRREPRRLGERFAALESGRLAALLERWLDVELERGDFVVLATEQKREEAFADLELRLRVDRIDRLPDGRLLVLDYKTKNGNCRVEDWLGERPDEPQLPLYGALLEAQQGGSVAGVLFAQVRLENPRLVGVGDSGLEAHRIQDAAAMGAGWPALKAQWRDVLAQLARDFIDGEARVDPKTYQVCQYCALGGVCRIDHVEIGDAEV